MHIHIIGICGTFMGGLALLARELGHKVTGSDANVYPPMSTLLQAQGIALSEGYHAQNLEPVPELVIIGNALSRGNPEVEHVLDQGLVYTSGAQFLSDQVLAGRWVIAVAGTHGKTTTASMVSWILEYAGHAPGFLIGGVPQNFGYSARLGDKPFFVIEADEYDTAFFDKRSKFVHYRPRTAILNNLEFDHADIFDNLGAIETQFHHLIRTVPASGRLIVNGADKNLPSVLERGLWSGVEYFGSPDGSGWQARALDEAAGHFAVSIDGKELAQVSWGLIGMHNMHNGLAAIAAAHHAGVDVGVAAKALGEFMSVKRRLELRYAQKGLHLYDDFAHHPTEIAATLAALRARVGNARIYAVIEPRSNTMRMGIHQSVLAEALNGADQAVVLRPERLDWSLEQALAPLGDRVHIADSIEEIVKNVGGMATAGDHVLVMSNGGFGGLHQKLIEQFEKG